MYKLSIGAIARNEAEYLEEWIEFHLLQGVEHFFVYDNESTDGTMDVLHRYAKEGIVTAGLCRSHPGQRLVYNEILYRYKTLSKWIAFIDIDEFLYSKEGNLKKFLGKASTKDAAVAVHWLLFGSSGAKTKEPGLVIERFKLRDSQVNEHVKTIAKCSCTISMDSDPHSFVVNGLVIDEKRHLLTKPYGRTANGTADILCINHYATKSRKEALERWGLPRPDNNEVRLERFDERFESLDKNDVADNTAASFADEVKRAIEQRRFRASQSSNPYRR